LGLAHKISNHGQLTVRNHAVGAYAREQPSSGGTISKERHSEDACARGRRWWWWWWIAAAAAAAAAIRSAVNISRTAHRMCRYSFFLVAD
jgi:hypothetical protein